MADYFEEARQADTTTTTTPETTTETTAPTAPSSKGPTLMAFPPSVSLATITIGAGRTMFGAAPKLISATVTPIFKGTPHVVHAESGWAFYPTPRTFRVENGEELTFELPHVDAEGWRDTSGNEFPALLESGERDKGWAYHAKFTVVGGSGQDSIPHRYEKVFQPLVGQTQPIDVDLVPDGQIGVPVSAPVATVLSIAGLTGAVTEEQLQGLGLVGASDPEIAALVQDQGTATGAAVTSLVQRAGVTPVYLDAPYAVGSDVRPLVPDSTKISGWGSSSMSGLKSFASTMAGELGAAYYDGAKGGEISLQTAARLGSRPLRVNVVGGHIPATGSVDAAPLEVPAMLGGNMLPYEGTLNGVRGTLSGAYGSLTFTRATDGDAVSVPDGTPFLPVVGPEHRADVLLLWMGKNDVANSTVHGHEFKAVEVTNQAFDWAAPLYKRVLVIGMHADSDTTVNDPRREYLNASEAAWEARYGQAFLSIADFLASPDVWTYSGVTPTQADLDAQASRVLPPSLTLDGAHLNNAGRTAVTRLIKERLISLGWYTVAGTPTTPGGGTTHPTVTTLTSDSFTGTDGTEIIGRQTDTANGGTALTYEGVAGGTQIAGGQMRRGAGGLTWFAGVPMAQADYETTALITQLPAGQTIYIDARRQATSGSPDGYRAAIGTGGALVLSSRIGGASTGMGSYTCAVGDRVGLRVKGSSISLIKNGAVLTTVAEASVTAAGYTGVAGSAGTTAFGIDDLRVTSA